MNPNRDIPKPQQKYKNHPSAVVSSELTSISIDIIHLMLARRDNSAILPPKHTFQQSQTFADIDRLENTKKKPLVSRVQLNCQRTTPSSKHKEVEKKNTTHLTL